MFFIPQSISWNDPFRVGYGYRLMGNEHVKKVMIIMGVIVGFVL